MMSFEKFRHRMTTFREKKMALVRAFPRDNDACDCIVVLMRHVEKLIFELKRELAPSGVQLPMLNARAGQGQMYEPYLWLDPAVQPPFLLSKATAAGGDYKVIKLSLEKKNGSRVYFTITDEIPWVDWVRFVYGLRCCAGHGDPSRTLSDTGAIPRALRDRIRAAMVSVMADPKVSNTVKAKQHFAADVLMALDWLDAEAPDIEFADDGDGLHWSYLVFLWLPRLLRSALVGFVNDLRSDARFAALFKVASDEDGNVEE